MNPREIMKLVKKRFRKKHPMACPRCGSDPIIDNGGDYTRYATVWTMYCCSNSRCKYKFDWMREEVWQEFIENYKREET